MNPFRKNVPDGKSSLRPEVHWFFRLHDADSSALEPETLQEWERFAAVPANRRKLTEVQAVWQAVRALGGPTMPTEVELAADDYDDSWSISQWTDRATHLTRSGRKLLLAASLAAAIVGVAFYGYSQLDSHEQVKAFATPTAEQRLVKLADGSVVTLGARTEIHTQITAAERLIVLDRGEAWFKVAPERQRPFRVFAGSGVITAIGTEFNVRRDLNADLDRVTVTVGAGAVKVEPQAIAHGMEWKTAKLVKGEELSYDREGQRSVVKQADVEAAAAWKQGRLEYIHRPLKAVVASVNRYSEKPIVLGDDSVGELDFSGTVFEGQIDDWVQALRSAFPISVAESDERILIHSRSPK